ncbi:DNA polymerase II [Sessilibacter sp. MAH1]
MDQRWHSDRGFILTRQWHDLDDGICLELWLVTDAGPLQLLIEGQESVFFIAQEDVPRLAPLLGIQRGWRVKSLPLTSFQNQPVAAVYFQSHKRSRDALNLLQRHIKVWEADIRPPERFLMERFINSGVEFFYQNESLQECRFVQAEASQNNSTVAISEAPNYRSVKTNTVKPVLYEPAFKVASVDIETTMDANTLYSIGVYASDQRIVFMVGDIAEVNAKELRDLNFELILCADEKACFIAFLDWVESYDPDILIGWSFINFDLWVLSNISKKLNIPFSLGRNRTRPTWRIDPEDNDKRYISINGRIALDGIELLRTAFYTFASFSLEFVARELLGEGKLLKGAGRGEEITELFYQDKIQLALYNLKDCELVWDIFEKTQLIKFAATKSRMTGMPLDRIGGSAASFEYAYLPVLHRQGYIAPNLAELSVDLLSPGGYVLDSEPGLYENVLLLDFKSLYPSIIRTFKIDPYAFWVAEHEHLSEDAVVPGFNGARFSREKSLLPDIVARLWQERDIAKKNGDSVLSFAIKIIMNSLYGVLGSPGCRFYDPRISSSITLRGHEIITTTQAWIEQQGLRVIYGDTDSVFVLLGPQQDEADIGTIGKGLAKKLNQLWSEKIKSDFNLESYLEIQFETHFTKFFMPSVRGADVGSKKRYAGVVKKGDTTEVLFRGLESVRSDWTPLARHFQETLYTKIFNEEPFEEFIKALVKDVYDGNKDSELIYRKRLRRKLEEYDKSSPPHVQAARKLASRGEVLKKGDWVDYVISVNGPEPLHNYNSETDTQLQKITIDYDHYVEKQLLPVADSLLQFLGKSFSGITDRQIGLF